MATFSSHPDLPEILENLLEDDVHTLFLKADCPPRTKAGGIGNLRLADVEGADDGGWDTLRLESLQRKYSHWLMKIEIGPIVSWKSIVRAARLSNWAI